eukprot:scaffold165533_cov17-Prasinocladus_malaysianus.AAC.1
MIAIISISGTNDLAVYQFNSKSRSEVAELMCILCLQHIKRVGKWQYAQSDDINSAVTKLNTERS